MITPQRDTDVLVLLKLKDNDLVKMCGINKHYQNICNDDKFWRLKVVNYIGKKQEKYNKEVRLIDENEIINIDYETIVKVKNFLEFPTWKEFYIFIVTHGIFLSEFTNSDFFTNFPQWLHTKDLPDWINRDKFYVKYKRFSFLHEERNALSYMVDELREIGPNY